MWWLIGLSAEARHALCDGRVLQIEASMCLNYLQNDDVIVTQLPENLIDRPFVMLTEVGMPWLH